MKNVYTAATADRIAEVRHFLRARWPDIDEAEAIAYARGFIAALTSIYGTPDKVTEAVHKAEISDRRLQAGCVYMGMLINESKLAGQTQ